MSLFRIKIHEWVAIEVEFLFFFVASSSRSFMTAQENRVEVFLEQNCCNQMPCRSSTLKLKALHDETKQNSKWNHDEMIMKRPSSYH